MIARGRSGEGRAVPSGRGCSLRCAGPRCFSGPESYVLWPTQWAPRDAYSLGMPTRPTASNVVAFILPTRRPLPYPSDGDWYELANDESTAKVARYLARWLRVRSPPDVSTWSMDRLREHYSPLILERWRSYSPMRAGAYPVDNGRPAEFPWISCPLRSLVKAAAKEAEARYGRWNSAPAPTDEHA